NRVRKPLVNPAHFLQQCAQRTHQAIITWGIQQDPPVTPHTTAVLALLQEGRCYWGHAGDSRFYLIRKGKIHLISRDHVLANEPQALDPVVEELHPGIITRCLGGAAQRAGLVLGTPVQLLEEDIVLLCSDGFWNQLDEEEMLLTLHNVTPLHNALSTLGEAAKEFSPGQSDNITAVGVRMGSASFGIGLAPVDHEEDAELLQAIEHLNKLIERTF
ncbi:MAG TPA: serine/threonine-protein phosphatase, partial [Chromatiaceae bacterium]|nr:serine/threonine-protein phosphatase [Chromatiaceae bacterium]